MSNGDDNEDDDADDGSLLPVKKRDNKQCLLDTPPQGNTGFVQRHVKEIPGLFQDISRTFFRFQGLNFVDFQPIFYCFCRKWQSGNRSHFISNTRIFSLWH